MTTNDTTNLEHLVNKPAHVQYEILYELWYSSYLHEQDTQGLSEFVRHIMHAASILLHRRFF